MKKLFFTILISLLILNAPDSCAQLPFSDGFESGGFITGGWVVSGNTVISTQSPATGTYCAEGPSTYGLLKNFPSITETVVTLEYDIRMAQTNTLSLIFRIKDAIGNTAGGLIVNDQAQIIATDGGGGNLVTLQPYDVQIWYHIKMVFDMTAQQYDIYIDNQLLGDDFDFYSPNFTAPFDFSWSSIALAGTIWIDNVNITGGMSGINEHASNQLTAFVNQAGQLMLHNLQRGLYDCSIYNSQGMRVFEGSISENAAINTNQLARGPYFVQLISRNQKSIFHSKVIVK